MKKIILLIGLLMLPIVSAEYVEDSVQGYGLEVMKFQDELLIVDSLLYNQEVSRNFNRFNGNFFWGFEEHYKDPIYGGDANFYGSILFDDMSKVEYKVEDFKVEETNVDEYGMTEAWGPGLFTYTITIKMTKTVPAEVYYSFYQDEYYSSSFGNYIEVEGDDLYFEASDDYLDKNNFKHDRKVIE